MIAKTKNRKPAGRPNGLVGRVQANLPRAKRNVKRSGAQKIVGALGKATRSTTAHKPSTRSMLGILAGGVGAAAVATRRLNTQPDEMRETSAVSPEQASDADSPRIIETVTEPPAITGGDHGDPPGPDPSSAL
jgi:hypothetical protein